MFDIKQYQTFTTQRTEVLKTLIFSERKFEEIH